MSKLGTEVPVEVVNGLDSSSDSGSRKRKFVRCVGRHPCLGRSTSDQRRSLSLREPVTAFQRVSPACHCKPLTFRRSCSHHFDSIYTSDACLSQPRDNGDSGSTTTAQTHSPAAAPFRPFWPDDSRRRIRLAAPWCLCMRSGARARKTNATICGLLHGACSTVATPRHRAVSRL